MRYVPKEMSCGRPLMEMEVLLSGQLVYRNVGGWHGYMYGVVAVVLYLQSPLLDRVVQYPMCWSKVIPTVSTVARNGQVQDSIKA